MKKGEIRGVRISAFEHRQAIFAAGRDLTRHFGDLPLRHLRQAQQGAGAITDNNVDPAAGERRCCRVLTAGRGAAGRPSDDLLRLFIENRLAPRVQRIDIAEHCPGVIGGRVGFWRRGTELDRRVEHSLDEVRGRQPDFRRGDSARGIADEHHDPRRPAVMKQFERVTHIGRREQAD